MALEQTTSPVEDARQNFRKYKKMAEDAVAQIDDHALFAKADAESNSIAIVMLHIGGNLRSRWTDFLSTDGEKPWRNRDAEFDPAIQTRDGVWAAWEAGWTATFETMEMLGDRDLARTITIRGEAHTVLQAISRSVAHTAYHVGQIVWMAKHHKGGDWKTLSMPKKRPAL
jgi:hypothetical protein